MSTQTELRAIVPAELADRLEAYFFETETIYWGVMQRERDDPYEVFGFFPDEPTADAELATLREEFPELPEDFALSTINDADWQNAYKEFVKPWSDRQLHWIPLWERDNISPPEGDGVVYLDAGMAFGTGAHETTRLCARRLLDYREAHPDQVDTIDLIDAGCGSGVLALSAAALGFKNIYAFDFDPEAIRVCEENVVENNHITTPITFVVADLEAGLKARQADLILANIQTDVLIPYSDHLVHAVAAGGTLALSGILAKELEQVSAHYQSRFEELELGPVQLDSRIDGEWADLLIQRG
ncbi:50S ribosomal protein L11 methyltransferase [Coraliomargarita sinensis]|uniref:Ribosomal protein L11 methyltransferase n=1 Tax=Coraliomargarita sinensis TaxID=2174842 RepID=A0A317ZNS6_9BACT|nr:50S ribosomal protein L11 methyltransferase [Coraliomargarita sinensis]PXA05509.1 50S ribosomal protein L11 methyltransferase [Coraliomargarita sinensis]